jgi:hypothetical protein
MLGWRIDFGRLRCAGKLVRVIQVLKRLVNGIYAGFGHRRFQMTLEFCRILEQLAKR